MSPIGSVSGGGYNRVQYPVYAGGAQNLSKCTYKVCETATGIHNGPNLITMSNADGDTVSLSEAALKAAEQPPCERRLKFKR